MGRDEPEDRRDATSGVTEVLDLLDADTAAREGAATAHALRVVDAVRQVYAPGGE